MSHLHCSRKRKSGQHLGLEDQKILEYLYNQNLKRGQKERFTQKELANQLGWSEATLSRELKRGMVKQQASDLTTYQSYSSYVAQSNVKKNWEKKGPSLKIGQDHQLAQMIEEMLLGKEMVSIGKLRYSPTAIVMHFEKKGWPTATRLCARTIYHYVEKEVFLHVTSRDLPRKGAKPKRRYRRLEKRLSPPDKKRIDQRPKEAQERLETGHWEMDCIESVKADRTCLLTLVDRSSRESMLFKIGRQTQEAVLRKLNSLERRMGTRAFREKFKTITVDNGAEFADWKKLETSLFRKEKRTEIYYARAYASWEGGSNENLNGFIRYFIPKGSRLKDISVKEIKQLEEFINRYPRKILGGSSAKNFPQAAA